MPKKKEPMNLRCELTPEEVAARADLLADKIEKSAGKKAEAKVVASTYKSEVEKIDAEITALSRSVRDRSEYRDVDVEEVKDLFNYRINTVRVDTGEIVDFRSMTEKERNLELFPNYPTPVDSAPEAIEEEAVVDGGEIEPEEIENLVEETEADLTDTISGDEVIEDQIKEASAE